MPVWTFRSGSKESFYSMCEISSGPFFIAIRDYVGTTLPGTVHPNDLTYVKKKEEKKEKIIHPMTHYVKRKLTCTDIN